MKRRFPGGFSLVEVALALGVAAFCLLAVFALLPVGLKTQQMAIEQTAANRIVSAVIADLRCTPPTATSSPAFAITIPSNTAGSSSTLFYDNEGHSSVTLDANSRYQLTITFAPNGTGGRAATLAHLIVTWPAAATPANAAGSSETFVALDRN
ncbi:MAG TPA: Verru_Chthon cassette protein B [Chthoniobacterales bacterium]